MLPFCFMECCRSKEIWPSATIFLRKSGQVLAGLVSVGLSVKPESLTVAIIADMGLGEERADAQRPGSPFRRQRIRPTFRRESE